MSAQWPPEEPRPVVGQPVQPAFGQPGQPVLGQPVQPVTVGRAPRPAVDAGRLWAGGLATAVVAALIAIVGILVARGVLKIDVLAPQESGAWGDASTVTLALVAFAGGLLATALIHGLLLSTPSPFSFFGWIMGLATIVAAVLPFTTSADLDSKIATAVIYALIGIGIWTLTDSTAHRSLKSVSRLR